MTPDFDPSDAIEDLIRFAESHLNVKLNPYQIHVIEAVMRGDYD